MVSLAEAMESLWFLLYHPLCLTCSGPSACQVSRVEATAQRKSLFNLVTVLLDTILHKPALTTLLSTFHIGVLGQAAWR